MMTPQVASLQSIMNETNFLSSLMQDSQASLALNQQSCRSYPVLESIAMRPSSNMPQSFVKRDDNGISSQSLEINIDSDEPQKDYADKVAHGSQNDKNAPKEDSDFRSSRTGPLSQNKLRPVKRTRYQRRNSVTASILLQQLKNSGVENSRFELCNGKITAKRFLRRASTTGSTSVNNCATSSGKMERRLSGEFMKMERRLSGEFMKMERRLSN